MRCGTKVKLRRQVVLREPVWLFPFYIDYTNSAVEKIDGEMDREKKITATNHPPSTPPATKFLQQQHSSQNRVTTSRYQAQRSNNHAC